MPGTHRHPATDDATALSLDNRVRQPHRLLNTTVPPADPTATDKAPFLDHRADCSTWRTCPPGSRVLDGLLAPLYLRALFGYAGIAAGLPALVRATIGRASRRPASRSATA
ncbi:hypothetical protein Airi01_000790 [Actinoallomurus iriomotensis]|uniref:Uncharacterized protein n=1 Tax=Actinoallomurus iriomotensis TaxID=478107 RepID=A0A9W6VLU6_9ACTN|nr:hypothetical protein Airi01_000790 [Actinoallomurus iriomotensis]